ncbi:MAG TPA: hypothetical protein VKQ29_15745 [Aliidongia sp.]|nr:hypothetical protein [Aliidongia sp.]
MSISRTLKLIEASHTGSAALDATIAEVLDLDPAPYTRSLDAAMRLVPEGWSIAHLSQRTDGRGRISGWTADLFRPNLAVLPDAPARLMPSAPLALATASFRALVEHAQAA